MLKIKILILEFIEDGGLLRGAMKCWNTFRNTRGEGAYLGKTDTSVLKHGDQTGLETPVVHALNDANSLLVF